MGLAASLVVMPKAAMLDMAKRFETARKLLGIETPTAMSREVWSDPKKRTRYETTLRTLTLGESFPGWDTLGPIVRFLFDNDFELRWLLFGEGPMHALGRRRVEPDPKADESGERPTVRKRSPG